MFVLMLVPCLPHSSVLPSYSQMLIWVRPDNKLLKQCHIIHPSLYFHPQLLKYLYINVGMGWRGYPQAPSARVYMRGNKCPVVRLQHLIARSKTQQSSHSIQQPLSILGSYWAAFVWGSSLWLRKGLGLLAEHLLWMRSMSGGQPTLE